MVLEVKNPCNAGDAGDVGSIPGSEDPLEEEMPTHSSSCLENPMARGAWRASNQSILKETSPEYLLEELMLKLKLQYFGHLIQRTNSLEKTLILGKIEGRKRRGTTEAEMAGWHHRLDEHEFE